jgi:hypothetical protein
MASFDASGSVLAPTVQSSDMGSVIVESAGASEAASSIVLSKDTTEVVRVAAVPAASLLTPQVASQVHASQALCIATWFTHLNIQDSVPVVVATSGISIGVEHEPVVSSFKVSKFQDAGVQTEFDGEKLPDGFVPYTKHRFLLLLKFSFLQYC